MIRDITFRITGVEVSGDLLRIHRDVVAVSDQRGERTEQMLGSGTEVVSSLGMLEQHSPIAAATIRYIKEVERLINADRGGMGGGYSPPQSLGVGVGVVPDIADEPDDAFEEQRPGGRRRQPKPQPIIPTVPLRPDMQSTPTGPEQAEGDMEA